MLTQSAKVDLALSGLALVAALAYGISTGERDGVLMLLGLVLVAAFAGIAVTGERSNELPPVVPPDAPPPELHPVAPVRPVAGGLWPALGAVALTLVLLGFVVGPVMTVAGLVVGVATVAGWMTGVSSDHTGMAHDLLPIGLPVVGLFSIFSLMFFLSRVLLAVPEQASTAIALLAAITILATASLVTMAPELSKQALVAILAVASAVLGGGGIVAAAVGPRKIEKPAGVSAGPVKVAAQGLQFLEKQVTVKADLPADISFKNEDKAIPHNIAIFSDPDFTKRVFTGDIIPGPVTVDYRFTAPPAGTYYFHCDVHPSMQGKLVVTA
ncbi:MAG: cupredoxin domain-containing protein [Acidimicrobiales bacterium]